MNCIIPHEANLEKKAICHFTANKCVPCPRHRREKITHADRLNDFFSSTIFRASCYSFLITALQLVAYKFAKPLKAT